MTPNQAKTVAESFSQLESRLPELGAAVYDRLFYVAPETRSMFKGDMRDQHRKLVNVIVEFVKLRGRSQHFLPVTGASGSAVVPGLNRLRSGHTAAGVKTEHYAMMRKAILASLAAMLGEKFDQKAADAWGAAFDMLAETMQKPESATPEEAKLLSTMFDRKFEGAKPGEPAGKRGPSADDFFERKQDS
ncbi:MAG: globin domain-containing protein [Rhodomicrobium sp.]